MKIIIKTICIIFALFCCVFPFTYKHSFEDKSDVKVSHILVDTEEEANSIREQIIEDPQKFEELAEKYSKCPSSAEKGNLGYRQHDVLVKPVDTVVFNLKKDEISKPVKSEYGWHILKVTDIKYFSDKKNFAKRF